MEKFGRNKLCQAVIRASKAGSWVASGQPVDSRECLPWLVCEMADAAFVCEDDDGLADGSRRPETALAVEDSSVAFEANEAKAIRRTTGVVNVEPQVQPIEPVGARERLIFDVRFVR